MKRKRLPIRLYSVVSLKYVCVYYHMYVAVNSVCRRILHWSAAGRFYVGRSTTQRTRRDHRHGHVSGKYHFIAVKIYTRQDMLITSFWSFIPGLFHQELKLSSYWMSLFRYSYVIFLNYLQSFNSVIVIRVCFHTTLFQHFVVSTRGRLNDWWSLCRVLKRSRFLGYMKNIVACCRLCFLKR